MIGTDRFNPGGKADMLSDRLTRLISEAEQIVDEAITEHIGTRTLVATCILFSGGNDSTVLFHLLKHRATYAVHANTTIGVEATRQFVRDQCAEFGVPLMERSPEVSYREHVLAHGFPGPGMHFKMYQQLKERALRIVRRELVKNGYRERVLFLAGRRSTESARRTFRQIPRYERVDSVIWASPLIDWTADDMSEYRKAFNVPCNPVADALGMSGECECGCFAEPGERERLRKHAPETEQEITDLESDARAAGLPAQVCQWGWGAFRLDTQRGSIDLDKPEPLPVTGRLCSSCDARWENRP